MPHVDDQFSGHLTSEDPRGPAFGAFGCVWPTIPPWRWNILSDDATGFWLFFNSPGVVLQFTETVFPYTHTHWDLLGTQLPFEFVNLQKIRRADEFEGYTWQLTWKLLGLVLNVRDVLDVDAGRCNVNVPLPNWSTGIPFLGSFGDTARMEQVLWDGTTAP